MKEVTRLVQSLKPGEVQLIKHIYSLKNSPEKKKRDRLFNLTLEGKVKTDKEAMAALYPKSASSAFSQLKTRLKSDILNTLILQESTVKYRTPYAQALFDCRRILIQGHILLSRGLYDEAVTILRKAQALAKKYELYAEQVGIEDMLRKHLVMKEGVKPFEELSVSINGALLSLGDLENARYQHYKITVPELYQTNHATGEGASGMLQDLRADYKRTGSSRVGFYYHMAGMQHGLHIRDFNTALEHGMQLLEIVKREKPVASNTNVAGVSMELANMLINVGRYAEAIPHARVALKEFKNGMFNELLALEKLFFACFRNKDYAHAGEVLKKALNHKQLKYSENLKARWLFIKAGLEFSKCDFEGSLKSLRKDTTLLKDKSGWLLGYCILEIMNRVEKGNYDWVDYRFEAFKKMVQRYGHKKDAGGNKRSALILQILRALIRNNYNFELVAQKESTPLDLLRNAKDEYFWDPMGYEIVRFDEWVESKQ